MFMKCINCWEGVHSQCTLRSYAKVHWKYTKSTQPRVVPSPMLYFKHRRFSMLTYLIKGILNVYEVH
jgi:hypothetical protein